MAKKPANKVEEIADFEAIEVSQYDYDAIVQESLTGRLQFKGGLLEQEWQIASGRAAWLEWRVVPSADV